MKKAYNPKVIESKWQKEWEKNGHPKSKGKNGKYYIIDMFPYPSGDGLHVGHVENFTATDIYARFKRMNGYDVLHPIGWDAFGLPAENFAIKTGIHPGEKTLESIKNFKRQMRSIGLSYDWDREINTSSPEYYKWTQWMFLFLYKNGLAYKKKAHVNWCPKDATVLANEQVIDGKCDRCGSDVVQKELEQWFFKITDFVEDTRSKSGKKISGLLSGLKKIDWPSSTIAAQKHWIGRSEGAEVIFPVANTEEEIKVFTTRVDTIFGCTYVVVAPEHPIVTSFLNTKDQISNIKNEKEVRVYLETTKKKTDLERTELNKEKTGVKLVGIEAINPFTGGKVPVYVADYVLGTYGTGAVMGVPAHDERDFEFAKRQKLPLKSSVAPYIELSGDFAPRKDKKTTHRDSVTAIVLSKDGGRVLMLKRRSGDMYVFPGGGIDKGETPEEAIAREVREETGYMDFDIVRVVVPRLYGHGYKERKGTNCFDPDTTFEVRLKSEKKEEISEEENQIHEVLWVEKDKVANLPRMADHHEYMWKMFCGGEKLFCDDGIVFDSGEFTGLSSEDAREKMSAWLTKEKLGGKCVQYRLRDWLISRQRYWGAPIPIVYCMSCGAHEVKTKLGINFYDQKTWKSILAGEKTIETRALNPEEKHRYFGDVNVGDQITIVNKKTKEKRVVLVKKVSTFSSVAKLFANKALSAKVWPWKKNATLKEWEEGYRKTAPGYMEKIKQNGLVAWEIELVNTEKAFPVSEKNLPVKLPTDVDFRPTGESPLVRSKSFQKVSCPECGGEARRESDTMDTFVCSSWYYLRYADPNNTKRFADPKKLAKYLPVDFYMGGAEHTVLHLLYARFFTKALMKHGYLEFDEPFQKLRHQGMVLAEDGRKMSKSLGNVVNPDEVIGELGADTLRLYEMFMGPLEDMKAWNTGSTIGLRRFLEKVWRLGERISNKEYRISNKNLETILHKTIKSVTEDIEALKFNTAISALMILVNTMEKEVSIPYSTFHILLVLLSPFAPHITEELWALSGEKKSIFLASWPKWDAKKIIEESVVIAVQVNGKVRTTFQMATGSSEEEVKKVALADAKVQVYTTGKTIRKIIYIQDKILSLVVG